VVPVPNMRTTIVIGAVLLLWPASGAAQVGTGWVLYQPSSTIQLDGSDGIETYPGTSTAVSNEGASFTNEGGIETFALHDPISNRAERRMQNTYLTGRRQFEGEVRVSPPTNDESVMQIFGGNSGATTQMIRAYAAEGGSLRKVPGSVLLAANIHGVWVKVNVVHDIGANAVETYINGMLLASGDGEAVNAGTDGWYHKYGCYGTLRTGSAKVEWRNVKHFRDGTPPPPSDGGSPSPGPDAGADAAPDGLTSGDAAPDGTGTGGSGGGEGSGGAGGSGQGGAGGGEQPGSVAGQPSDASRPSSPDPRDPTGVPPFPDSGGCGCRAGAGPVGSSGIWLLLGLLAAARLPPRRWSRRSSRPGRRLGVS
jgi:hypothetical protein